MHNEPWRPRAQTARRGSAAPPPRHFEDGWGYVISPSELRGLTSRDLSPNTFLSVDWDASLGGTTGATADFQIWRVEDSARVRVALRWSPDDVARRGLPPQVLGDWLVAAAIARAALRALPEVTRLPRGSDYCAHALTSEVALTYELSANSMRLYDAAHEALAVHKDFLRAFTEASSRSIGRFPVLAPISELDASPSPDALGTVDDYATGTLIRLTRGARVAGHRLIHAGVLVTGNATWPGVLVVAELCPPLDWLTPRDRIPLPATVEARASFTIATLTAQAKCWLRSIDRLRALGHPITPLPPLHHIGGVLLPLCVPVSSRGLRSAFADLNRLVELIGAEHTQVPSLPASLGSAVLRRPFEGEPLSTYISALLGT